MDGAIFPPARAHTADFWRYLYWPAAQEAVTQSLRARKLPYKAKAKRPRAERAEGFSFSPGPLCFCCSAESQQPRADPRESEQFCLARVGCVSSLDLQVCADLLHCDDGDGISVLPAAEGPLGQGSGRIGSPEKQNGARGCTGRGGLTKHERAYREVRARARACGW